MSACFLLTCAGVVQAVQGYPDAFSVVFLLLGVTSVIHHCRLDEWWKYDVWRLFDYVAILVFFVVATARFGQTVIWPCACCVISAIVCLIWTGCVDVGKVPMVHACMHVLVCIVVLYLCVLDAVR